MYPPIALCQRWKFFGWYRLACTILRFPLTVVLWNMTPLSTVSQKRQPSQHPPPSNCLSMSRGIQTSLYCQKGFFSCHLKCFYTHVHTHTHNICIYIVSFLMSLHIFWMLKQNKTKYEHNALQYLHWSSSGSMCWKWPMTTKSWKHLGFTWISAAMWNLDQKMTQVLKFSKFSFFLFYFFFISFYHSCTQKNIHFFSLFLSLSSDTGSKNFKVWTPVDSIVAKEMRQHDLNHLGSCHMHDWYSLKSLKGLKKSHANSLMSLERLALTLTSTLILTLTPTPILTPARFENISPSLSTYSSSTHVSFLLSCFLWVMELSVSFYLIAIS